MVCFKNGYSQIYFTQGIEESLNIRKSKFNFDSSSEKYSEKTRIKGKFLILTKANY